MSKKRTSAASYVGDEQTNEDSESLQRDAKREKFDSVLYDTTLQDLPMELLGRILVSVVAMEVKGWKLAMDSWKDKAELVMSRLSSVCEEWKDILATNFFRNELQRTLDGYAQKAIHLVKVDESQIPLSVTAMTTLKDDVFLLSSVGQRPPGTDWVIEVYDRSNLAVVKDAIPIPGAHWVHMRACSVSNCVYVSMRVINCDCHSVARISKDAKHQYGILPWHYDRKQPLVNLLTVSAIGSVVIASIPHSQGRNAAASMAVYSATGSLQHELKLKQTDALNYMDVMQKSNGNLVVSYITSQTIQTRVIEVDMIGTVVRQYDSSSQDPCYFLSFADAFGRIMLTDLHKRTELLDSELNLLSVYSSQLTSINAVPFDLHYEPERSEIVCIYRKGFRPTSQTNVLALFRFTEE